MSRRRDRWMERASATAVQKLSKEQKEKQNKNNMNQQHEK